MNTKPKSASSRSKTLPLDTETLATTSRRLKAIAHPMRLAIIDLLRDGSSLSVTEIYKTLALDQAVASQHLGILREFNFVDTTRKGKNTFYHLRQTHVLDVISLMLMQQEAS